MTNFIFKSQGTYKKLCQQLDFIQSEQRHQRSDLSLIIRLLTKLEHKIVLENDLQKQVDDYFDETPHQTDQVEQ